MIRRYNIWEEDLDHAVVLYQATYLSPEIIQHKAYLTLRGVKHIDEGNEFELSRIFNERIDELRFYETARYGFENKSCSDEVKEAAVELLEMLKDHEGCSESFPYDFAQEVSEEFEIPNPFESSFPADGKTA